jgi:hypothetical protein
MAARHRGFMYVFYPESAPDNFREMIASWNVPAMLAFHDRDEGKKPHYHLLLTFGSMKSLSQVHELVDQLGSKVVEPAYDIRASARYLGHLDQPEKFQYGMAVVEGFSGAPVLDLMAPVGDPSPEILAFIRDQGIVEYSKLIDYCLDERMEWYHWASTHSIFLCSYLRSCRHYGDSGG